MQIKRIVQSALVCLGLSVVTMTMAQPAPQVQYPTKITWTRTIVMGAAVDRAQQTYTWGTQTLPSHPAAWPGTGFAHHTLGVNRPAGTNTQVLNFRFRSSNLFAANPGAHFAVAAKSESTSWYNRGRGFIVGGLAGHTWSEGGACGSGIRSQPETFFVADPVNWIAGNHLWGGSHCGATLSEGVWYDVTIHANTGGWFAYTITQGSTVVGGGFSIHDTTATNPDSAIIDAKLSGFTFGLVFADNLISPFTLEFDQINSFWF